MAPPEQPSGGPARDRQLRAQGRRTMQRLQDAAEMVFTERGYHAARIDDIVSTAETSHGTFYLYFSNKDDVLLSLLERVREDLHGLAESLPELGTNGHRAALRAWVGEFCDTYDHHGAVIRAYVESDVATARGERVAKLLDGIREAFEDRISNAESPIPAGLASLAVVALLERFPYLALTETDGERERALDAMTAFAQRGLFGS